MASYQELRSLFNDSDLLEKVEAAAIQSVNAISEGTSTSADNAYIDIVYTNTNAEAKKILKGVLAKNASLTVVQIQGASDAAIQAQVDLIVPILINAKAGV